MCGIGGVYFQREVPENVLVEKANAIRNALRHRGPDGSGVWTDPESGLAFAHSRLAIIDLSENGHQPMVSKNGRWTITFNGEVYNYPDLKLRLEKKGIHLRGHSDTETILESIAEFGLAETLNIANGMFAIALWDRELRRLFLIRDRVGIKPLYYGRINDAWIFGSELKAFRNLPERPEHIDVDALGLFMRHGYVPDDACIFKGMYKVPAGSVLTIENDARAPVKHAFWSLQDTIEQIDPTRIIDEQEATEKLKIGLTESIQRRLIADVPVGAFLSGGVDSSLIVSLLRKELHTPVQTFTIGFENDQYDESRVAGSIAKQLGTKHRCVVATAQDAIGLIDELPQIYDEPFADSSAIPTLLVSRLASQYVKVVLSGDGGDELFAGYDRYGRLARMWPLIRRVRKLAKGPARLLERAIPDGSGLKSRVSRLAAMFGADSRAGFYRAGVSIIPDIERFVPDAVDRSAQFMESSSIDQLDSLLQQMMYIDFVGYLPGDILTKVDRATMSVGLEARVPLLDHKVVEAAWQLPMQVRGDVQNPKIILKKILSGYIDRSQFERPKSGFSIPIADWLRGPLSQWAEEVFAQNRNCSFFNMHHIEQTWKLFVQGQDNRAHAVWNALIFLSWYGSWCAD